MLNVFTVYMLSTEFSWFILIIGARACAFSIKVITLNEYSCTFHKIIGLTSLANADASVSILSYALKAYLNLCMYEIIICSKLGTSFLAITVMFRPI